MRVSGKMLGIMMFGVPVDLDAIIPARPATAASPVPEGLGQADAEIVRLKAMYEHASHGCPFEDTEEPCPVCTAPCTTACGARDDRDFMYQCDGCGRWTCEGCHGATNGACAHCGFKVLGLED